MPAEVRHRRTKAGRNGPSHEKEKASYQKMKISQIIEVLEAFAPPKLALPGDKIGLQVGDREAPVKKILVALDPTSEVITRAVNGKANLIVTHHPLIFEPLEKITPPLSGILEKLLRQKIALYTAHTNLDIAPGGVADTLAERIGLTDTEVLLPTYTEKLFKLAVFVPQKNLEQVRIAMCRAGAGVIGKYTDCTFMTSGIGTFRAGTGAKPHLGEIGRVERVGEGKLETLVPEFRLPEVIRAMKQVHPYEEVAYDVYPLENKGKVYGLGRVGELKIPRKTNNFITQVKQKLKTPYIRTEGKSPGRIKRIALGGGTGNDLVEAAAQKGAEVLLVGELKYSARIFAQELGLFVIEAGHAETERVIVPKLAQYLKSRFSRVLAVIC